MFPVDIIVFILWHVGYSWASMQRSHFLLWFSLLYDAGDEGFSRLVSKGQKNLDCTSYRKPFIDGVLRLINGGEIL